MPAKKQPLQPTDLTHRFALLALNGIPIMKMTALKHERIRAMLCACFFDLYLEGHIIENHGAYELLPFMTEDPPTVCFLAHYHNKKYTIRQWLHLLASASRKILDDYESAITIDLITKHLLDEVSDLTECDLMHEPSEHASPKYRSANQAYHVEYHRIRQLLSLSAYGKIPRETLILYWLMEQSYLAKDLFSPDELTLLRRSRPKLCWQNEYAKRIFKLNLDHSAYIRSKKREERRKKLLSSKLGSLLGDLFPSLQPRETIFLASKALCQTPEECVEFAAEYLKEKKHHCNVIKLSDYPVIEVDNVPYKLIARTLTLDNEKIPGVQLFPSTDR